MLIPQGGKVKPRKSFNQSLLELQNDLIKMGEKTNKMITKALQALTERNTKLAEEVIEMDDAIDKMDLKIEKKCMFLIATQQPMARDLRTIGTALKIITDVERIGDYCVDIARKAIILAPLPPLKPYVDLPKMADLTQKMLSEVLIAFKTKDLEKAREVAEMDHEVDRLYNITFDEIMSYMVKSSDNVERGAHLILVARYFERIGDHITNIAERIFYMEKGKLVQLNV